MDLAEFLEFINSKSTVRVLHDGIVIMSGRADEVDYDKACLFEIIAGSVTQDKGVFIVEVESTEEINKKKELENGIAYLDVIREMERLANNDEEVRDLFLATYLMARDYASLREKWDKMSDAEMCRRNYERATLHDIFIDTLDNLTMFINKKYHKRIICEEIASNRKQLGNLAMEFYKRPEMFRERKRVVEAIIWAIDHSETLFYIAENAENCNVAKEILMTKYSFSQLQAQTVIDMRYRGFLPDSKAKILEEYESMQRILHLYE